jgi:crotonobetainyl-CoA:carnitine CoA-transferase CaiB-like acyl-CoA transferase
MADFGAEVIKIEPPGGDSYREFVNAAGMPTSDVNYPWLLSSRNKKSVVLDLVLPEGREVLLTLVRGADVLVSNYTPSRARRLRVTYEELAAINPRLVYASITGYGNTGPDADKLGFDINGWWARSGLMDLVRAVDALPSGSMPGMGDHPTGMALLAGIMMALFQRERTGRGARVSTSLLANGAWANGILIQALLCGASFQPKRPRDRARNALGNLYQSRDGRWFLLTIMREEREWPRLAKAIGRPELVDDPRFISRAARREHSATLIAILDEVFAGRDWEEWREALQTNDITSGPVARLSDVRDDAQMRASEVVVPLDGLQPDLFTVAGPISIADQPQRRPGPAPRVGQHTDEVLRAVGYDADAIAELRARNIVA